MWEADEKLLLHIQEHHRKPILNPVMIFITNVGNTVWFAAGICLWLSGTDVSSGQCILITLFASWGLTTLVLKPLIGRKRAYHAIDGLTTLISEPKDKAFPSAHASIAFAGAFAILLREPFYIGAAAVLAAAVMGYSRLYVGVHYLSDVLGGAVTGFACAMIVRMVELAL